MSTSGIGPNPEDPLDAYYRVEEIERLRWEQKKKRGGRPPFEPPDSEKGLAAFVYLLLSRLLGLLKQPAKNELITVSDDPARDNLLLFKAAMETMMREDRSQDSAFLKRLSNLWQQALEHGAELQTKSSLGKKLKAFIKDIESYPESEEHTFGYYLNEFAGQNWLPFPYIEMIQKLHREHVLAPSDSLLSKWAHMLHKILVEPRDG